jgi:hypothetical protein
VIVVLRSYGFAVRFGCRQVGGPRRKRWTWEFDGCDDREHIDRMADQLPLDDLGTLASPWSITGLLSQIVFFRNLNSLEQNLLSK